MFIVVGQELISLKGLWNTYYLLSISSIAWFFTDLNLNLNPILSYYCCWLRFGLFTITVLVIYLWNDLHPIYNSLIDWLIYLPRFICLFSNYCYRYVCDLSTRSDISIFWWIYYYLISRSLLTLFLTFVLLYFFHLNTHSWYILGCFTNHLIFLHVFSWLLSSIQIIFQLIFEYLDLYVVCFCLKFCSLHVSGCLEEVVLLHICWMI